MTNPEFGHNPEQKENTESREALIEAARHFLIDEGVEPDFSGMSDVELREYIQTQFQRNLEDFFDSSGLADAVKDCKTEEDILHLLAEKSEGTHGWVDMLPSLAKSNPGAGMNCTMNSAMLHIALERLGYDKVRTVAVKGHHIVLRELDDGSFKLLDPSSKSLQGGKLVGYSQIFKPEQITDKSEIDEDEKRRGFAFVLDRGQSDDWGGFHMPDEQGKFTKKFYAYDPSINMDISIALGNLSEIKKDAEELGGVKDLTLVDSNEYIKAVADFIKRNNQTELSDEDIRKIGQENPNVANKLLALAEQCVKAGEPIPNPFTLISGELVKPKEELDSIPDPHQFIGEAKLRHEQAKALCEQYPELKRLDYDELVEKFKLFRSEQFTT